MADEKDGQISKFEKEIQRNHKENLFRLREQEEAEARKRSEAFQLKLNKFQNTRRHKDPHTGQEMTDWEKVSQRVDQEKSAQAFNSEWKYAILALVDMLMDLNKALSNTIKEITMPYGHALSEGIRKLIKNNPANNAPIPTLLHGVTLNKDNILEVNITKKGAVPFKKMKIDGETPEENFNDLFRDVVVVWLAENGYKPHPAPAHKGKFIDSSGKLLTNDPADPNCFEKLKNDPIKGIDCFLKNSSDLQYEQSPGMSPS